MPDDGNGMEVPDGSEIPDPGDPRGRELDFGRPERVVLDDPQDFLWKVPGWRVRMRPDMRWEVEVWSKAEEVLLNKISRKAAEIRREASKLRRSAEVFDQSFNAGGVVETSGLWASSTAIHVLHRDWQQVMDVARQLGVNSMLIDAAMDPISPVFYREQE